jgi:predicted MFS family arabinose efflux permease
MALQFQTVASTGPFLIDALSIDFASIGILIGLYMLPGVAIALPGGVLGQRFGAKRVVLIGLVLMAIGGGVMGLSHTYWPMAVGRLISGTGAVLFNVMITKMIADWFAGREIVTAMGIFVSSWPFGLAVALMVFGPLAATQGYALVMHLGALACLVSFALVLLLYRDPPDMPAEPLARFSLDLTRREWLTVSAAGLVWGFLNSSYIVLVSFAPEVFTQRGFSIADASLITSLLGWSFIPAIPLWSIVAERLKRPNLMMHAAFIVSALALAALPFAAAPLIPLGVLLVVPGAVPGLIMALPAQTLRVKSRASGMGVYYTVYYALMALVPAGAGLARDVSGSFAAPTLFAAGVMLLCVIALMLFHAAKRIPEQ